MSKIEYHVVEVKEVIGEERATEYTNQGWIVLAAAPLKDKSTDYFIYALGRLEAVV